MSIVTYAGLLPRDDARAAAAAREKFKELRLAKQNAIDRIQAIPDFGPVRPDAAARRKQAQKDLFVIDAQLKEFALRNPEIARSVSAPKKIVPTPRVRLVNAPAGVDPARLRLTKAQEEMGRLRGAKESKIAEIQAFPTKGPLSPELLDARKRAQGDL